MDHEARFGFPRTSAGTLYREPIRVYGYYVLGTPTDNKCRDFNPQVRFAAAATATAAAIQVLPLRL